MWWIVSRLDLNDADGFSWSIFAAFEAEGCGGLHAEYELAWKAEGETFFDDPWAAESQWKHRAWFFEFYRVILP